MPKKRSAVKPVAEEQSVAAEPVINSLSQTACCCPSANLRGLRQLILVPDIGSDDEIDVIEVSVAIGDQVEEGDTLLVLESDKATMDVPSSHSGTVIKILAAEGRQTAHRSSEVASS